VLLVTAQGIETWEADSKAAIGRKLATRIAEALS